MKDAGQQAEFYRQIGESIRRCRKRRQLSQDALAKLVGLTRTSLTNIESGRQHPPLHTLCEIVEYLKVELSELLPRPLPEPGLIDVEMLAGTKVRGDNELAFIEVAIGMKGRDSNGNPPEKNSGNRGNAAR